MIIIPKIADTAVIQGEHDGLLDRVNPDLVGKLGVDGVRLTCWQVCNMIEMFYTDISQRHGKDLVSREIIEANQALADEIYLAGHRFRIVYDGNTYYIRDTKDPKRRLLYGTEPLEAVAMMEAVGVEPKIFT